MKRFKNVFMVMVSLTLMVPSVSYADYETELIKEAIEYDEFEREFNAQMEDITGIPASSVVGNKDYDLSTDYYAPTVNNSNDGVAKSYANFQASQSNKAAIDIPSNKSKSGFDMTRVNLYDLVDWFVGAEGSNCPAIHAKVKRPFDSYSKQTQNNIESIREDNFNKGYGVWNKEFDIDNDLMKRVMVGFGTNLSLRIGAEDSNDILINPTFSWDGKPAVGMISDSMGMDVFTLVIPSTSYKQGSHKEVYKQAKKVYDDIKKTILPESNPTLEKFVVNDSILMGSRGTMPNGKSVIFMTDKLDIVVMTIVPNIEITSEDIDYFITETITGVYYYDDNDPVFTFKHYRPVNSTLVDKAAFTFLSNYDTMHIWNADMYDKAHGGYDYEYTPDEIQQIVNNGKLYDVSGTYYETDMSNPITSQFFEFLLGIK